MAAAMATPTAEKSNTLLLKKSFIPKKTLFGCCSVLSAVCIVVTGLLIGSVSKTYDAVDEICQRVKEGFEMECIVQPMATTQANTCQDTCAHEFLHDAGNVGPFFPGLLGLDDGKLEEGDSFHEESGEIGSDWTTLLRESTACSLTPSDDFSSLAQATCGCSETPLQVTMRRRQNHLLDTRLNIGCTRISFSTGNAFFTHPDAEEAPACLWLPPTAGFAAEITVGVSKQAEMNKCEFWTNRFSMGSHHHWVYSTLCICSSWCFLISMCALTEQFYKQHRKKNAKLLETTYPSADKTDISTLADFTAPSGGAWEQAANLACDSSYAVEGQTIGSPQISEEVYTPEATTPHYGDTDLATATVGEAQYNEACVTICQPELPPEGDELPCNAPTLNIDAGVFPCNNQNQLPEADV